MKHFAFALFLAVAMNSVSFAGGGYCAITNGYPQIYQAVANRNLGEIRRTAGELDEILSNLVGHGFHESAVDEIFERVVSVTKELKDVRDLASAGQYFQSLSIEFRNFLAAAGLQDQYRVHRSNRVNAVWVQRAEERIADPY